MMSNLAEIKLAFHRRVQADAAMRKARIAAMPRVRFCYDRDRDWDYGAGKVIGVYWGKNPNAAEGEFIYQRCIELCWSFHFDVRTK